LPVSSAILTTTLDGRAPDRHGKVRDLYQVGDRLLIVATDRISAFDYVLGSGIPDKGKVLTQMSAFWFSRTRGIVANHLVSTDPAEYPRELAAHAALLAGRSMLVERTRPLPIECVARGYLAGSGWKDYQASGRICGHQLPSGLVESDRLPQPIFTPATKAETGHDINISEEEAARLVGRDVFDQVRDLTLRLYADSAAHAESRGIIIADTKFEFGLVPNGDRRSGDRVLLIDEALTPDSSRFWPLDGYRPGGPQPSFDKQFVRDYLESIRWNKQPPVPALPDEVVARTRDKYLEAFRRLTDHDLDRA
jgi:phosphoribosylaminoimidazole-succinocarboxamide synthase